jgi:hypothetical protein
MIGCSPTIETLGDLPFQPGSPGGEMKCPVCGQWTPDAWTPWYGTASGGGIIASMTVAPPIGVASEVSMDSMYCANDECKQLVIRAHENYNLPSHAVTDPEMLTRTWFVRPRAATRLIDPLVPEPFRTDYLEAAAILDPSPRMSAVLSRRVLGDLLERFAGQTQFSLAVRIDKFIADSGHPSYVRENLHHFREIADFGAHTQKDAQADIIDVSREEAEWTLDILDSLFDYFVLAPERNRKIREGMDQKIADARRKPILPAPEDDGSSS